MDYIYTLKPTRLAMVTDGPTEQESEVLGRHAAYLEALAGEGIVELAGRTQNADETTFGLVVFRAENEDAARALMDEDPAVASGIMSGLLFPYRVAFRSR